MASAKSALNISANYVLTPAYPNKIGTPYHNNKNGTPTFYNGTFIDDVNNSFNFFTPLPQHDLFVNYIKNINHEYDELKTQLEVFSKNTI